MGHAGPVVVAAVAGEAVAAEVPEVPRAGPVVAHTLVVPPVQTDPLPATEAVVITAVAVTGVPGTVTATDVVVIRLPPRDSLAVFAWWWCLGVNWL